ncbi:MAG: response regulator transcription factor [Acidobacteria bacterium]|nr:response regulator transcription factor [Acidobacteriota bacterium]MBV9477733.1 response regulator transcription factor [Acidobacteriota bacterium]
MRHRAGTEFEIHVIGTPVYIEGKAAGVLTVAIPATSVAPLGDDVGVLTPREREVLRFSAEGHSSAGIAQTLGISRRTVESHRASIHRKLGTASQAELILFALRHGLVRFSSDR